MSATMSMSAHSTPVLGQPRLAAEALERTYMIEAADVIGAFCRVHGRRVVTVDGFSGVGKTSLAEGLGAFMPVVSLDDLLSEDYASREIQSYIDRLDLKLLGQLLGCNGPILVEGVMVRDVLQGLVSREKRTDLYIARCSRPAPDLIIWHDGIRVDENDSGGNWMDRAEVEYHRRQLPHLDADKVIIRLE